MADLATNGIHKQTVQTPELLRELGSLGLKQTGGYVQEEFLRALSGSKGIRVYREMAMNDATIGAILFAIEMLVRQVPWRVEPADESPQALEWAERIHGALFEDMSQSWPMLLSEILTYLPYGWSLHELVWKRCQGDEPPRGYIPGDPAWDWWAPSRYNDGLLTFRKLPIRAQETLLRWEFDASGGVQGMVQQGHGASQVLIPIDKALLFRAFSHRGNPEGKSILRNAYESWYYAKSIRRLEGIGVERDLAGMFHARIPMQYFAATASAGEKAVFEYVKKMATRVHRDEQEGLVTPLAYDEGGNELFKFELLTTGGSRQMDTDKIVQRYDLRIMQSVLANVLMVGIQGVGSYALSASLSDLFTVAITTFLDAASRSL